MNIHQRIKFCEELAAKIVKSYRDEAPDGSDPQNSWGIVAGAVISAGVGVYSANQQKKAAAKAGGALKGIDAAGMIKDALSADDEDLYGKRFIPEEYKNKVGTEDSYARDINDEALKNLHVQKGGLPGIFELTARINKRNLQNANSLTGDRFGAVIKNEGKDINSMLKGRVPDDVVDSINRLVAEHLGGASNPAAIAGGFDLSATASDTARRLGITSFDIMQKGISFAPAWQQTVQQFLYRPDQAAKDFLFPQVSADLAASKLQEGLDESEYYSRNNLLRAEAAPDPAKRGRLNDALTILALQTQAGSNVAAAQAGLVNSVGALGSSVANLGTKVAGYNSSSPGGVAAGTPYATPPSQTPALSGTGPQPGTYYT